MRILKICNFKTIILTAALLWVIGGLLGRTGIAFAQTVIEAPQTMDFAGMKLELCESVRIQVETEANNLMRNNRFFRLKIERSDAYMHIVERIFLEENLPDDFKYLVIQESGLISDAVSSSNAVGFWQFKKATGLEVGLTINDQMDERMNIVASSRGAARYLKRMNASMRNWVYALLSYYAGLGGARLLINTEYIGAQETMILDEKTHWYIIKFLAHKLAFEPVLNRNPNLPLKVLEFAECQGRSLEQIAGQTNIALEEILLYNKWLKNGPIPADKPYTVLLPVKSEEQPGVLAVIGRPGMPLPDIKPWDQKSGFLGMSEKEVKPEANLPATAAASSKTGGVYQSEATLFFSWNGIKAIQARKNDNIAKLALQGDIDKEDFLEYNDMRNFDLIAEGQVYYIKRKRRKAKVPFHTVQQDQTLWEISQNYGITMKALLKKNRMKKPEKLRAGRILWLRKTRSSDTEIEYAEPSPSLVPAAPLIATNPPALGLGSSSNAAVVWPTVVAAPISDSAQQAQEIAEDDADTSKAEIFVSTSAKKVPITLVSGAPQAAHSTADTVALTVAVPAVIIPSNTPIAKITPIVAPAKTIISAPTAAITKTPVALKTSENKPVSSASSALEANIFEHKVIAGQSLYSISRSYDVPTDSLIGWNNITNVSLRIGQLLIVKTNIIKTAVATNTAITDKISPQVIAANGPIFTANKQVNEPETAGPQPKKYMVRQGDTLFKIARENNVSVQQIQQWNGKTNLSLTLGEQILIR